MVVRSYKLIRSLSRCPGRAELVAMGAMATAAMLAMGCGNRPIESAATAASPSAHSDTAPSATGSANGSAPPSDPDEAALLHQLHDRWGWQEDKDGQLRVPMVDWKHYERVRYWAVDHFVGFKYGDNYDAMNIVFIQDVPKGTPVDTVTCLRRADKWSNPLLKNFDVKLDPPRVTQGKWNGQRILIESLDGYVDFGLERHEFSAAYAAYPAYPDACLLFGFAAPWHNHEDLAKQVRDRWVREAIPQIRPLTKTRPYRK